MLSHCAVLISIGPLDDFSSSSDDDLSMSQLVGSVMNTITRSTQCNNCAYIKHLFYFKLAL